MKCGLGAAAAVMGAGWVVAGSVVVGAQWPKHPVAGAPRDAQGNVQMDAPAQRTADGTPDLSGVWMRAESGPPRGTGPGRGTGVNGANSNGGANSAFAPGRGGV